MGWDERERLTETAITLASYVFGGVLVVVLLVGAVALVRG